MFADDLERDQGTLAASVPEALGLRYVDVDIVATGRWDDESEAQRKS